MRKCSAVVTGFEAIPDVNRRLLEHGLLRPSFAAIAFALD
ncbi:hypothetical protein I552_9765 [Mycobacterium xenopi 3993]|nr:hypothetical protein I552_9765 [Mycobacterium xenopi 3993]